MTRIILCFSLLAVGYLLGVSSNPLKAESSYFYGNDGTMGSVHQSMPGAPMYYYDNNGNSGMMVPDSTIMPNSFDRKSPC